VRHDLQILTPTSSSRPTPQLRPRNDVPTPSLPSSQQSPIPTGDEGLEINLGPITLTGLRLSNPRHVRILVGFIVALVTAYLLRKFIQRNLRKVDKEAFRRAEDSFGARIDRLEESHIVLSPPSVDFWHRLINPEARRQAKEFVRVAQEVRAIRQEIQEFQKEHRGKINERLEDAIQHLYEVSAAKPPNIDAIVSALEGIRIVAERLNLDQDTTHYIRSVVFQLRKRRED
jgi:hypothetical protein